MRDKQIQKSSKEQLQKLSLYLELWNHQEKLKTYNKIERELPVCRF